MGWANRITVARGLLTLVVWVLVARAAVGGPADWWWTFALFVLAAVTDVVDGALARRLGDVSVFGRIADPLVDKLLILGTITALLPVANVVQALPVWVALLILLRELLVTVLRAAVEANGGNFQAAFWGKLKMIVQCVAIGTIMAWKAGLQWLDHRPAALGGAPLVILISWLAAAVTAISLLDYARRGWRSLSEPTG